MKEVPHPSSSHLNGLLPTTTKGFCRTADLVRQPYFKLGDKRANVNPGKFTLRLFVKT